MKVQEKNFKKIARPGTSFRVPAFQRQYSWRTREFEQLWRDIQDVLDGTRKKHFMGTVVLKPDDASILSVIDGQQRLATFLIILKVLHKLSIEYASDCKREVESLLFHNKNLRLIVSYYDKEAFNTLFEDPSLLRSSKKEHRNVKECYEFFDNALISYIESSTGQRKTTFSKILDVVTERMAFVEIALGDEDDIHAIFETINHAGMPLTSADLARNYILSQAKTEVEQERLFVDYWRPLEDKLRENLIGRASVRNAEFQRVLPEFLRAVLVIERRKYISASDLFGQLRTYFRDGRIEEKLKLFNTYADEYCKFLNVDNEKNATIRRQLLHILELRMTTFNPVLLVLFESYSRCVLDFKKLKQALQYIESFLVRRTFNTKVSRDLGKVFAKVASVLSAAKPNSDLLNILVRELTSAKWPTDEEFKACFLSSPIYTNAPVMARFALISLEKSQPTAVELDLGSSVQIEHIFPQGADSKDWPLEDMADLKKRLHVMGNLTLTKVNQKLGRRGFLDKKLSKGHGYKNSAYWVTRTFMRSKNWNADEVDSRGKKLLKSALKIWPYPE